MRVVFLGISKMQSDWVLETGKGIELAGQFVTPSIADQSERSISAK